MDCLDCEHHIVAPDPMEESASLSAFGENVFLREDKAVLCGKILSDSNDDFVYKAIIRHIHIILLEQCPAPSWCPVSAYRGRR